MGGIAFRDLVGASFFASASQAILPTALLVVSMLLVNTLSVSAAIALTMRRPLFEVWSRITKASVKMSFLLIVLAFYLSWLSTNLGVMGTAGLVVPMIAVRQLYRTNAELTTVTEELLDLMEPPSRRETRILQDIVSVLRVAPKSSQRRLD